MNREQEESALIPREIIENRIFIIRKLKVMLDKDLSRLYGVPTKVLNQAVKRNFKRFPEDFMIRLTKEEKEDVVTICDHLDALKVKIENMEKKYDEQFGIVFTAIRNMLEPPVEEKKNKIGFHCPQ